METLLIVDDDLSLLESLKMHFEEIEEDGAPKYQVVSATSAATGLKMASEVFPALVILDMMLPDRTGLQILKQLKEICRDAPIVIVTAYHDMETTIRAMKAGAFDYIHKPFTDPATLDLIVARALQVRQLSRRAAAVNFEGSAVKLGDIVGNSPGMQRLIKEIGKVAASRATVLITGESGTGKELIARVIHNYSYDEARPFVGINCSAIVDTLLESELFGHEKGAFTGASAVKPGKFELAEDGTLFLDEIGDMSLSLQAKLLRVFQEREFERVGRVKRLKLRARVIAATHRELPEEVKLGRFREDLYQRLKVITLHIPPLRERREDIPLLVKHFLERFARDNNREGLAISPEALRYMVNARWEGNVRELRNLIESLVVMATRPIINVWDLPEIYRQPTSPERASTSDAPGLGEAPRPRTMEDIEREAILRTLKETEGNRT